MPFIMHLKAHKFGNKGGFLFISLATLMNKRVQLFTDLLFYAYVGIHKVRIPVFDNNQKCPAP